MRYRSMLMGFSVAATMIVAPTLGPASALAATTTTVVITGTPKQAIANTAVPLYGRVRGVAPRRAVAVQVKYGSVWRVAAKTTSNSSGLVATRYSMPVAAHWVRIVAARSGSQAAVASPARMVTGYRAGTYVAPTLTYTGATCTHPSKDDYKMFFHWTATGGIYDDVGWDFDIAPVSVFGGQRTFTSMTTFGPTDASPTAGSPWLERMVAPLGKGKDIMVSRMVSRGIAGGIASGTDTPLPDVPISCPPH